MREPVNVRRSVCACGYIFIILKSGIQLSNYDEQPHLHTTTLSTGICIRLKKKDEMLRQIY